MAFNFLNIQRRYKRASARLFTLLIRSGFESMGTGSIVFPPLRSGREEAISIGDNVFVGSDCWIQVMEGEGSGHQPAITIGDGVAISGHCTITAVHSVVIEADVLLARYVYISDHSHAYLNTNLPVLAQGVTKAREVRVGSGSWLGQSVVVCPGVTIGRNCVIGANSVVRQDIPDFTVAAGCPARVLRRIQQTEPQ